MIEQPGRISFDFDRMLRQLRIGSIFCRQCQQGSATDVRGRRIVERQLKPDASIELDCKLSQRPDSVGQKDKAKETKNYKCRQFFVQFP